jgi:hypothetical protein
LNSVGSAVYELHSSSGIPAPSADTVHRAAVQAAAPKRPGHVPFSSATLLALCSFASFAGFLFLNTLHLEQVRGFSDFHTGLCTLPLAIMVILCACSSDPGFVQLPMKRRRQSSR